MKDTKLFSLHYLNGRYREIEDPEIIANSYYQVMSKQEASDAIKHFRISQGNTKIFEVEAGPGEGELREFLVLFIPDTLENIRIYGYCPANFTNQNILDNVENIRRMKGPWNEGLT
jgi:hypothetical protein